MAKILVFPEVRQRTVRMVLENQGEYDSQWAAICSIVPKDWLYTGDSACLVYNQHEWDTGAVMVDSPPLNVSV